MGIVDKVTSAAADVVMGTHGTKASTSTPSEGFNYGTSASGAYWDRFSDGIDAGVANQRLKPDLSPSKYVPSVGRADKHASNVPGDH